MENDSDNENTNEQVFSGPLLFALQVIIKQSLNETEVLLQEISQFNV